MRTEVGIVGGGPAGLLLARLLELEGIESVVLESRSRDYVERRLRAGVLEQGTVDLLNAAGVGARMTAEGLVHGGIELRFDGQGHRIPMSDLTGGRAVTVYGQTEVVKDLIQARIDSGGALLFEAAVEEIADVGSAPSITYTVDGAPQTLDCDFVAGCDGFHGVCRPAIPADLLTVSQCDYPFAWLGILAQVAPSTDELIYARHDRGFAMHSMRSPEISRLYLQCEPTDDAGAWSDDRIWEELHLRLATDDGWQLTEGPIIEKGVTPMRSFVASPMQFGRMYLAGDAAHIVPPTGAKGLNLAVQDVRVLAAALTRSLRHRDDAGLTSYTDDCLRRVWRAQHFSWWMTTMLHVVPGATTIENELQRSQLRYVCSSEAAATSLSENYVGLEHV